MNSVFLIINFFLKSFKKTLSIKIHSLKDTLNNDKIFYICFFVVLLFATILRITRILHNDFYYDEAATWYVATKTSLFDLIQGKFHHVGDMPLSYILMKPWFHYFSSEVACRLLFVLIGVVSLILVYKIFRLFEDRLFSLAGIFLLSISPAHIEYSSMVRSYIVGFLIQCISIYFFFIGINNTNKQKIIIPFFISCILALFCGFSSFYLLVFFILAIVMLNKLQTKKTNQSNLLKKLLFVCTISLGVGVLWLIVNKTNPQWQIALINYVGYKNNHLLKSLNELTQNMYTFISFWEGSSLPYRAPLESVLRGTSTVLSILIVVVSLVLINKDIRNSHKKLTQNGLFLFSLLLTLTLSVATIFSFGFFNVLSIKLVLFTLIPWVYINVYVVKMLVRHNRYFFAGIIIFLLLSLSFYSIRRNYKIITYPSEKVYSLISKEKGKKNLLITNEIAYDLIEFYENKNRGNVIKSIDSIKINTNRSDFLSTFEAVYLSEADIVNKYDKVFYFKYYDSWQDVYSKNYEYFYSNIESFSKEKYFYNPPDKFFFLLVFSKN